jgi:hypothetical protein
VSAQLTTEGGKNLPGPAGMSAAAADRGGALFVWETADRRFCSGSSAADGGAIMTACASSPRDLAFSDRPRLVPLFSTVAIGGEHHVIGADRETVLSVTCNGKPLAFRELAPVLDGRRQLYAFDLPGLKFNRGWVTVTVVRAHTTATEHVNLMAKPAKGRPACR